MAEEAKVKKTEGGIVAKKSKAKQKKVFGLVFGLILIVLGGTLFIGAIAGWFEDSRVEISEEYYCEEECPAEFMALSGEELKKLQEEKKSFVVFIDQAGCQTAKKLGEYVLEYMGGRGLRAYRMSFSNMKESSLYPTVKYYPSVILVSEGKIKGFLRADAEEDSDAYNKKEVFFDWMDRFLGA